MSSPTVLRGDALEQLASIGDNSIDAIITDPPYGLTHLTEAKVSSTIAAWLSGDRHAIPAGKGFGGEHWDAFVPPPAIWDECFRVLKPGGHLAAFAGARTQDLMGLSIRLAGFEMRGSVAWIRSDQFAKGARADREVERAGGDGSTWTGWASTLKPGHEPILLARKPLAGSLGRNLLKHGVGALHESAVRVPYASVADRLESEGKNRHADYGTAQGGNRVYGDYGGIAARTNHNGAAGRSCPDVLLDSAIAETLDTMSPPHPVHGLGPSRFFPIMYSARAHTSERPVAPDGTEHPSVKPLSVMRWLCRLLVPPGGVVLDPFLGSGTTAEAAIEEGFRVIGIEREAKYFPLIEQRVRRATGGV